MRLLRSSETEERDESCPLGDEWRITNDESMMNDENLGSAGASPATASPARTFGARPKSFRQCPARRVTLRAARPRSPFPHSIERDSSTSLGMTTMVP